MRTVFAANGGDWYPTSVESYGFDIAVLASGSHNCPCCGSTGTFSLVPAVTQSFDDPCLATATKPARRFARILQGLRMSVGIRRYPCFG